MKCPFCDNPKTKVVAGNDTKKGNHKRYRKCPKCKQNFRTIEYVSYLDKKEGDKE